MVGALSTLRNIHISRQSIVSIISCFYVCGVCWFVCQARRDSEGCYYDSFEVNSFERV